MTDDSIIMTTETADEELCDELQNVALAAAIHDEDAVAKAAPDPPGASPAKIMDRGKDPAEIKIGDPLSPSSHTLRSRASMSLSELSQEDAEKYGPLVPLQPATKES